MLPNVINYVLELIILIISGFGSGVFVGMGSGTTGSIMITSLTVFVGYSIHQAKGTSLLIDCIIGGIAGFIFLKKGKSNFIPAILIAGTGAVGSHVSCGKRRAEEIGPPGTKARGGLHRRVLRQ